MTEEYDLNFMVKEAMKTPKLAKIVNNFNKIGKGKIEFTGISTLPQDKLDKIFEKD